MDNTKIIDRIRKLLAMSEDTGSPNEAAIAAGRAAKLMQQYNLDHADVILTTASEDSITENASTVAHKAVPQWIASLIVPVANLHDCEARYKYLPNDARAAEFLGMQEDVLVATYVFEYLIGEINRLAERFKARCGGTASRKDLNDFRLGASFGVLSVLETMQREKAAAEANHSAGKALVVVKHQLIQQKYDIRYSNTRSTYRPSASHEAGLAAGASVSIRDGLTQGKRSDRLQH